MDGSNHINGYALGESLGTDEVEAKGISDLIASLNNNLDLDPNRVLELQKPGTAEQQSEQKKSGVVQQGTVEFIDIEPEAEIEESATLSPKASIAKSEVAEQIDLYDPVETDNGDDFDFDLGGDLSADDFGMFSILSSHMEDELDDGKDLDLAYEEEVGNMFSDIYSEASILTEEA